MPQNLARDEDNKRRRDRMKSVKKGPGVFVYDGSWNDTEWHPTYLRTGKQVAAMAPDGMPLIDAQGRQVYQSAGQIVRDSKGNPQFGGEPVEKLIPKDEVTIQAGPEKPSGGYARVTLKAGVPVRVKDEHVAMKLRRMDGFDELEGEELKAFEESEKAEPVAIDKPKRGRPRKTVDEVTA